MIKPTVARVVLADAEFPYIKVTVLYSDESERSFNGMAVDVFLDTKDMLISEIEKQAISKARDLMTKALGN